MTPQRSMGSNGSNHRQSISTGTTHSHFFKIILPSTIQAKKLGIPVKFVRNFGDELSSVATLTVANGRTWQMGLKKGKNKIWFHDGWQEFVESHSISYGYFLVFRYEGNSKFHVLILDTTACEVDYPCNVLSIDEEPNHGEEFSVKHEEDMEDDDSVEILGSTMPSPSHCSLYRKGFNDCVDRQAHGKRCSSPSQRNLNESSIGVGMRTMKDGKATASLKRPKFEHGYWTRTMKKAEEHEKSTSGGNEKDQHLTNDRDNVHAATPSSRPANPQVNKCEYRKAAAKVGPHTTDKMKQRTKSNEHELPARQNEDVVMISTRNYYSRFISKRRSMTTQERERAIHAARRFKPESPSFMVIWRPSERSSTRYVPIEFSRKYMRDFSKYIKLQVPDGREWPIKCIHKGSYRILSKGWAEFVTGNKLDDGDVCVFELIKNNLLKVSIFHVVEEGR